MRFCPAPGLPGLLSPVGARGLRCAGWTPLGHHWGGWRGARTGRYRSVAVPTSAGLGRTCHRPVRWPSGGATGTATALGSVAPGGNGWAGGSVAAVDGVPATRLGDLLAGLNGVHLSGDPRTRITSVTSDSRAVTPGALFVALPGRTRDGHRFLTDALARGAVALLAERDWDAPVPTAVVPDARRALAEAAAAFHGRPSQRLRVIGVTGTDGKTTTCHLLDHLLRAGGRRSGRIGSLGAALDGRPLPTSTSLTTPLATEVQALLAAMVRAGADDAVVEASSVGLAEHRLDAVDFDAAVVTNLTPEHLEQHGGMTAYRAAKVLLLDGVGAAGGLLVVNVTGEGARRLRPARGGARVLTCGVGAPAAERSADVRADEVRADATGSRFVLHTPWGDARVDLPLPGPVNVANAACAAAAALGLGVGLGSVAAALAEAPPVAGRMVRIDEGQQFRAYVDYAHTIAAVEALLRHLRAVHPGGRQIVVIGTGLTQDYWKRPLLAAAVVEQADIAVFTSGDDVYETPDEVVAHFAAGARSAGAVEGRGFACVPGRDLAIAHAVGLARPGDVVAVLGKGHEPTILVDGRRQPWSDEAVVRDAIRHALRPVVPAP